MSDELLSSSVRFSCGEAAPTPFTALSELMGVQQYQWSWKGQPIRVTYEVQGTGKPILLLPALSTVSSREELRELGEILAQYYQVCWLDWVGFGQSDRPNIPYTPQLLQKFLRDFVYHTFSEPIVVVAAGHAAGYVMELAQRQPNPWSCVVLVAPTWRGPLPTAMGERRKLYRSLQQLVNLPIIGQILYFFNTTVGFLRFMYQRHVYGDRTHVTSELMNQKLRISRQPGARFAPAAFVTGALDPVKTRQEWLSFFQPVPVPVMTLIGEQTPPKSREEMEIMAHFSSVQVRRTLGSLGMHEEYPGYVAAGILPFLEKYLSAKERRSP